MKPILTFLKSRPAIAIKLIEEEAGLPRNTLANLVNGSRKTFPDGHVWPLCRTLCRYGLELNGWVFTYDENTGVFFIESRLDKEPEIIEHEEGRWFEYKVSMSRSIIGDEYELLDFIKALDDAS